MSRARDRVQNRNETFLKSLISNVKLHNSIFKMLLLSSLHWERNFSVVNNGFFSSKIRFQKLVNLVSAGTKTASVTSYSLRGSISDKKPQLEQKASPVCVSSRANRLKRTDAATPSASRACWEFCAAAFSIVWSSNGMRSEAWARVSPGQQTNKV